MARGIPSLLSQDAVWSAAQINYDIDVSMFEYFRSQGWVPQLHASLGAGAAAQAPGILADYPWSEIEKETIIDIRGRGGGFIAMLLRAHKSLKGGIFDLLHVIEYAKPLFHSADGQFTDAAAQVFVENLIGGDFFESIPPCNVYTMKWTLYDWRDEDARCILSNIEKAIIPGENSRLTILEEMLDTTRSARLSRYGAMNMMMTADGVEPTKDE
ncbi:hypothetical protein COCVIDRAFT_30379 [Bipolaris victoriae FI3]|uniref:O-methyltransferase C-terminal domain-containing protein n=1 Tax=Bipolaris victoriae (strain FI3) TaxID=930091 RepID=W7EER3_BIPV3|nr:hypothetical protein COCVIDRAFT_30379 [Bipolaris victoriae FI3]